MIIQVKLVALLGPFAPLRPVKLHSYLIIIFGIVLSIFKIPLFTVLGTNSRPFDFPLHHHHASLQVLLHYLLSLHPVGASSPPGGKTHKFLPVNTLASSRRTTCLLL